MGIGMPLLVGTAEIIPCSIMFTFHFIYCSAAVRGNVVVTGIS